MQDLLTFATDMPYLLALKYKDQSLPKDSPVIINEVSDRTVHIEPADQPMENVSQYFKPLLEEFFDRVFGYESRLSRADWERQVLTQQKFIFKPTEIRDKIKEI